MKMSERLFEKWAVRFVDEARAHLRLNYFLVHDNVLRG